MKEKNRWELTLTIQYFWKLLITFFKEYLKKVIITSNSIDSELPIAKSIIRSLSKRLAAKRKQE